MRPSGDVRPQQLSAADAVALVPSGATLLIEASGGGVLEPDLLIEALGERFARSAAPNDLELVFCSGVGDRVGSGVDRLADPHLLRRVIGGHYGMSPAIGALVESEGVEGYNLPQGVLAQLYREIAGGRPGLITKAGLGTFIDPRQAGGRLNRRTTEELVELVEFDGEEWLRYKPFSPDVAFVRGTTADENGNVSIEREAAALGLLHAAAATRNSGGIVIVQVERVVAARSIKAQNVRLPGHLVDVIVTHPRQRQTVATDYNPGFSGEYRVPIATATTKGTAGGADERIDARTIIARRALAEIPAGSIVNLGVGVPDGVPAAASHRGVLDQITLTIEQGLVGGLPATGVEFGAAWNPDAMIEQASQFDFYDGGGLDCTCLGFAEIDRGGNVNSSMVAGRVFGVGGFVNISSGARHVIFCGTFNSGGLETEVVDGRLVIGKEGRHWKFVETVGQVSFNAAQSAKRGQRVTYVTERAVFRLGTGGLVLEEVAPGIDAKEQVIDLVPFPVEIGESLGEMASWILTGSGSGSASGSGSRPVGSERIVRP